MRVVIAPFNRMSDTTLAAVRAAGHEVICTGCEVQTYDEIANQYPADWRPDVFIFWSPEYNSIPRDLELAPCLKVGVFGDWNLGGQAVQQSAATFDLLIADTNGADRLRALGYDHVVSAPLWSFDPDLHRRRSEGARDIDILMVGNFNHDVQRERGRWLARVARISSRYRVLLTSGVFGDEYVRLMNRARIVFNRSIRGEINMRAYEASACGALLFYERENREIRDLYQDRKECVLYGDDDLESLLEYYLEHEDERSAIADAGHARVQCETPSDHIARMFDIIADRLASWPGNRAPAFRDVPLCRSELQRAAQWLLSSDATRLAAAEDALRRAERHGLDPAATACHHGYLLTQAGRYVAGIDSEKANQQAIGRYQAALGYNEPSATTHLNLSILLTECSRVTDAIPHLRRVIELVDDSGVDCISQGALYVPSRFGAFGVEYERVEISHRHGADAWSREMRALLRWCACQMLSDVAFAQERFTDALELASQAAALLPHIAETRFRAARASNALGDLTAAIAGYRDSLEINPFFVEARDGLVCALVDANRPAEALAVADDWAAIVAGCPVYGDAAEERKRLRAPAERAIRNGAEQPSAGSRILAFPRWTDPSAWTAEIDAFVHGNFRSGVLLLWADPEQFEPGDLLRRIASYLTKQANISPSDFPNLTVVSQVFAPHERWKLFRAATALIGPAPVPARFRDALSANPLPCLEPDKAASRAA